MHGLPPDRWQAHWHDCFDADPPTENDGPRPAQMEGIDTDYRLLCGFAWVSPETRRKGLAVMPQGEAIWPLIEDYLARPTDPISPDVAQERLAAGLIMVGQCNAQTPAVTGPVPVLGPDTPSLHEAFARADPPTIGLDDRLWERAEERHGPEGGQAYGFLTELFYWQGNTYAGAHYALWPLCGEMDAPNPYDAFLDLWCGGWSAGWATDGVFLYDRRAELCGKQTKGRA